jgi:hypothetical protein
LIGQPFKSDRVLVSLILEEEGGRGGVSVLGSLQSELNSSYSPPSLLFIRGPLLPCPARTFLIQTGYIFTHKNDEGS